MSTQFTTMVEALEHRAGQQADVAAFIFRDKHDGRHVLTWADLYTLATRFAAVLRDGGFQCDDDDEKSTHKNSYGVCRGDLVVNTLPNSPERVVCEVGVMLSGAASVNGQCLMADGSDLLRTLRVSRAKAILVDPDVNNSPWNVLRHHVTLGKDNIVTSSPSLPDLKKVYLVRRVEGRGPEDFLVTLQSRCLWFKANDVTSDDVLTVFTTSGSTGFSKLVVINHGYFTSQTSNLLLLMKSGADVRDFNIAPLGWVGGCLYISVSLGFTRVLIDMREGGLPKNIVEVIWKGIQDERCTRAYLSPKYLPEIARLAEKIRDHYKLNTVFIGGMPVNRAMVQAALEISEGVTVGYGSTDFGLVSSLVNVTDWRSYVDHDTGPPASGVRVKIVSQDDENVQLPVNQMGNILIQQPNMPQGYLNDPRATADLFTKDGFVRTGDVGRLDERGHLVVEGRGSDAIMRGPYIHYPQWLEDRIKLCPRVRDILVVGVPDPFLNEELCACVVLTSAAGGKEEEAKALKEVEEWVKRDIVVSEDDPLSPRPRYYLSFPSLPETSNDKPRRNLIKKMAAQRLGLA